MALNVCRKRRATRRANLNRNYRKRRPDEYTRRNVLYSESINKEACNHRRLEHYLTTTKRAVEVAPLCDASVTA